MSRMSRVGCGLLVVSGIVLWFGNTASAEFNIREKRLEHAGGHVPGEILVTFQPGVSEAAKAAVHARHGGRRLRVGYGNAFEVVAAVAGNEEALAQTYVSDPEVLYAEPNSRVHAHLNPNDSYFSFQWHMPQVKVQPGWDVSTGTGVVVAVVDTGIRLSGSQDGFANPLVAGYDFINNDADPTDDEGHGTHVAGTVAQATNNALGVTGVAFTSRLMAVKVLGADGKGTVETVSNGIRFAADNGAHVINLSLGRPPQFGPSPTEHAAVQYAVNRGVVVAASSGNEGSRQGVGYPARYDEAIAVGATRFDKGIPSYSNRGAGLDLVAPGGDNKDQNRDGYIDGVLQETFGSDGAWAYWFYIGTSQAAPHVSGAAALLAANGVGSGLAGADKVAAIRNVLETTAEDLGKAGYDETYGWGLLDIQAAFGSAPPPPPPADTTPPVISNVQATNVTDSSATITWTTDEPATSRVDYGLDATYGSTVADGSLVTSHSLTLISLSAPTTYHYQVTSADGAGNSASSGDLTFTTSAPSAGGTALVSSVAHQTFGGKQNNLHLDITVNVVDGTGAAVAGASVSVDIFKDGVRYTSGSATTDTSGKVVFGLRNAPSGCYTTTVTSVVKAGLTWDGLTPSNGACK